MSANYRVITLRNVKAFLIWLQQQRNYKARIIRTDIDYLNPLASDVKRAASARRKRVPTIKQLERCAKAMPMMTERQRRNRALFSFPVLTGARADSAVSFLIGKIDFDRREALFDSRESRTKFSKTYTADFFPVPAIFEQAVRDWHDYLVEEKGFSEGDALFPAIEFVKGPARGSGTKQSMSRNALTTTAVVRGAYKEAFEAANLPYHNPHSVRSTLGRHGQKICKSLEEAKAWSQNLGHESMDTTTRSYSMIDQHHQSGLMKKLRKRMKKKQRR